MEITKELIKNRFTYLNKIAFNNKLPKPLRFSVIKTNMLVGELVYKKDGNKIKSVLNISKCFDFTEKELDEVILHEMIHLFLDIQGNEKDSSKHGKLFKNKCEELNNLIGLNAKYKEIKRFPQYEPKISNTEKILHWIFKPFLIILKKI